MEGEPENSDKDIQGDDKPVVLWEKCIQQSIFVDLSEDESLHLSDLESSLSLYVSQAESAASEASIHLSGSAELSNYDTSSESIVNSRSERMTEKKSGSSILHVSAQRPNTAQDVPSLNRLHEDPGQNTSDEDHEDLPFDGDLGSMYFNQVAHSESCISRDGRETSSDVPNVSHLSECVIKNIACNEQLIPSEGTEKTCLEEHARTKQNNDSQKTNKIPFSCHSPVNQPQQLSKEDLLRSGRLIEAETLPEVSLLESMDETVFSRASAHSSAANPSNNSLTSETVQSCSEQKNSIAHTNLSSVEAENNINNEDTSSICSNQESIVYSTFDENAKKEVDDQKVPFMRTRSFTEMKYGQGQVHYPLPDFSKVAPKVKIPKAPRGIYRPAQQPPSTIHRAQSSPGMLEVISRVLDDSVQAPERPYVFKDQDKQASPVLVQHLQAEYDKLLAKYAEAENLIDQMRLGTNEDQDYLTERNHVGPLVHPNKNDDKIQTINHCINKEVNIVSSSTQPEVGPSDGELMTAELTNIISTFMQNVEDFKLNVSNMSVSVAEQQMILRSMMEAQDQLERKYMSKKEEHRALEMQNYMGICRNTGVFDPDRLVEGDIFRLGMYLEDIKEMIDKNVREQISPPQSSSTPLPNDFHIKPNLLCMPSPSPLLSLHEDQSGVFSIVAHEMEEEETEAAGHVDVRLEQNTETSSYYSRLSQTHLKGHFTPTAEDNKEQQEEKSILTEGIGHSNILAYFNPANTNSGQSQSITKSCSTQDSALNPQCNRDNCVSLSVDVSCSEAPKDCDHVSELPINTSISQRIVSPETDSGFGSSYLNQSASGSFQQNLNESFQSQNDCISSSGSEGSRSNLQTTIQPAALITLKWTGSHPSVRLESDGVSDPVKQWVESTTKDTPFRVQGGDSRYPTELHHYMSEPILSSTMNTVERGSPMYSCSCNSEAILTLQSEVSRLKEDMKEGLVQLPYLTQRLDYLTSQRRHEHRAKTRSRSHQSTVKSPSSGLNLSNASSSPVKLDWISTDIDRSKSKGTDTEDTAASESMLQFDSSPVEGRRGSNTVHPGSGFHSQRAAQSSRRSSVLVESFHSKEKWSQLFSSPSVTQKPLLQVNYGSSSSLPASYKLREYPLQSMAHDRKRSTQSDTALLPSNVFFQRTLSPLSAPSKVCVRTISLGGSKEEDINRTLDQAIEVARSMKRTTDRMAKSLSADLAKAKLQRKLYNTQPLRGRKHHAL